MPNLVLLWVRDRYVSGPAKVTSMVRPKCCTTSYILYMSIGATVLQEGL